MKAWLSHTPGPADTLTFTETPRPVAAPGQLLLRTKAVGLNYPDSLIIEDKYQIRPPRPFAPGSELCGEVVGIGDGVTDFSLGDRVVAVPLHGALAEFLTVPATMAATISPILDDVQAAVLPLVYGTVWHALVERGELQANDRVLVLGAGGGIGLAACQVATALGATVTAAASSEEKIALARNNGAKNCLLYSRDLDRDGQKSFGAALKEFAGPEGFDIVVDPIGGNYAEPALRAMAWLGRYLVVGFTSGIPKLPTNLVLLKGCDIRGIFWGSALTRDPKTLQRQIDAMTPLIEAGKLQPRADTILPLSDAPKAIAMFKERMIAGKIAITMA